MLPQTISPAVRTCCTPIQLGDERVTLFESALFIMQNSEMADESCIQKWYAKKQFEAAHYRLANSDTGRQLLSLAEHPMKRR